MVMAAGLGTRLRPITHEVPKPVVPVGNVAIVEQLVRLLHAHGADEIIANLHWFPETVRGRLGDGSELGVSISYEREEGCSGPRRRHQRDAFLTASRSSCSLGDALTDVDLSALAAAHRANGQKLKWRRSPSRSETSAKYAISSPAPTVIQASRSRT